MTALSILSRSLPAARLKKEMPQGHLFVNLNQFFANASVNSGPGSLLSKFLKLPVSLQWNTPVPEGYRRFHPGAAQGPDHRM